MKRSQLPSIKYTFKLCKKFSLYSIPKYRSSYYQKSIPFLSCKVQYTPRNSFLRRLQTEINSEVLAISAGREETGVFWFELAIVRHRCVWELMPKWDISPWFMFHTASVHVPPFISPSFSCRQFLSLDLYNIKCFILTGTVFKPWFISQYLILPSALLKPWFIAGLRESIQIKYCLAKPSPFSVSQFKD